MVQRVSHCHKQSSQRTVILTPTMRQIFVLFAFFSMSMAKDFGDKKIQPLADSKCMGELGCFKIEDAFYHPEYRPYNLLPEDRVVIGTKFLFFSRENPSKEQILTADKDSIAKSHFRPSRPTKIVIHGFTDDVTIKWVGEFKKEFLINGDYNIIMVDWGKGSTFVLYGQAAANIRVVGAEVALLINVLQNETNLDPKDVHILGHSLGAHAAGYAGERVKGLGKITGLDAADPYFQHMPPLVRLDPTDALFVEGVHTDTDSIFNAITFNGGFGINHPVGHVDFYPNGGHFQPGCDKGAIESIVVEGIEDGARKFVACNHLRVLDLYKDSINDCSFKGYECENYKDFKAGKCISCESSLCSNMGLNADQNKPVDGRTEVKLFFNTGRSQKYCRNHHKVEVKFGQLDGAKTQKGKFKIELQSPEGKKTAVLLTESYIEMVPGSSHSILAVGSQDVTSVTKVKISWECDSNILNPFNWCLFRDTILHVDNIQVTSGESQEKSLFCATNEGLKAGKGKTLGKSVSC